jgi:S1-C subfamily serine protease
VREVVLPGNQVAQLTDIPAILARVEPGVVTVTTNLGAGTGMVITPSGEVVTNYHVISGATRIQVTVYGQEAARNAVVTGFDQGNDVALLQVQGVANLPTVAFGDSRTLVPGDDVVAVGNALALPGGPTVTSGIVSAVGRTIPGVTTSNGEQVPPDLIQTDAAINPGNSGGPLVNAAGKVVGMNTLVITGANATQSAENLGFAIPIATIAKLIPTLAAGAKVKPAYLGVGVDDNSAQLAKQYGLDVTTGAIVAQVVAGGPAAQAGVKAFDVITNFGGQPVQDAASLVAAIDTHKPGDAVPFTVVRGHQTLHLSVTLGSRPLTSS